jgi:1-acyl-sn-glycerol-3-phosphate acyltransferase
MAEVARWPLIGPLARLVGTLFIERKRALDVGRANGEIARALRWGLPVTIFPESRPSEGRAVGAFHSALLQAAVENRVHCRPAALSYDCPPPAEPSVDVCWWGEMSFAPHLLKLARLPSVEARVRFGPPVAPSEDRKALARSLQEAVSARFVPVRAPAGPA